MFYLGAVFIFFVVPETKGKTEEQMRLYFKNEGKQKERNDSRIRGQENVSFET